MRIQYISDLHLEFKDNKDALIHIKDSDVLIIAGDLGVGESIFDYLIYLSKERHVIFVYGNHEFYNKKSIYKLKEKGLLIEKENKNLHILDKKSVIIDNVKFIGATGWIDGSFKKLNQSIYPNYNDFYQIKDFKKSHQIWGKEDSKFLENEIKNSTTKYNIMITHFLPLIDCISKTYIGDIYNPCFSNNYTWMYNYSDKINYWIHGHSHEYLKRKINSIEFCRNSFGYPYEKTYFKANEFITI